MTWQRQTLKPYIRLVVVVIGSPQGGMDIEDVAETNPEAIYKVGCGCYWQSTGRHGHRGRGRDKP